MLRALSALLLDMCLVAIIIIIIIKCIHIYMYILLIESESWYLFVIIKYFEIVNSVAPSSIYF